MCVVAAGGCKHRVMGAACACSRPPPTFVVWEVCVCMLLPDPFYSTAATPREAAFAEACVVEPKTACRRSEEVVQTSLVEGDQLPAAADGDLTLFFVEDGGSFREVIVQALPVRGAGRHAPEPDWDRCQRLLMARRGHWLPKVIAQFVTEVNGFAPDADAASVASIAQLTRLICEETVRIDRSAQFSADGPPDSRDVALRRQFSNAVGNQWVHDMRRVLELPWGQACRSMAGRTATSPLDALHELVHCTIYGSGGDAAVAALRNLTCWLCGDVRAAQQAAAASDRFPSFPTQ